MVVVPRLILPRLNGQSLSLLLGLTLRLLLGPLLRLLLRLALLLVPLLHLLLRLALLLGLALLLRLARLLRLSLRLILSLGMLFLYFGLGGGARGLALLLVRGIVVFDRGGALCRYIFAWFYLFLYCLL